MKKLFLSPKLYAFATALLFLFAACNNGGDATPASSDSASTKSADNKNAVAVATLSGTIPDTAVNGTVRFEQDGNEVKMKLDILVPTKANQSVAVHIHEMGDCGDMGNHAGGHWNPTSKKHGEWGSAEFHSGDIGNIQLDGEGKGTKEITSSLWSIGGSDSTNILNKTIIVHGGVDDYTSQPSGNSGARIGCGVIKQTNQ